jgi:hypothetical protein
VLLDIIAATPAVLLPLGSLVIRTHMDPPDDTAQHSTAQHTACYGTSWHSMAHHGVVRHCSIHRGVILLAQTSTTCALTLMNQLQYQNVDCWCLAHTDTQCGY